MWSGLGLIVTRFLSRGDCLGTPGMWSTGQARGGAMRRNQSGSEKTDNRSFYFRFRSPCQHLLPSTRLASDYDMKGCHRFSSHVKLNDSWHVINAPINILDATQHMCTNMYVAGNFISCTWQLQFCQIRGHCLKPSTYRKVITAAPMITDYSDSLSQWITDEMCALEINSNYSALSVMESCLMAARDGIMHGH